MADVNPELVKATAEALSQVRKADSEAEKNYAEADRLRAECCRVLAQTSQEWARAALLWETFTFLRVEAKAARTELLARRKSIKSLITRGRMITTRVQNARLFFTPYDLDDRSAHSLWSSLLYLIQDTNCVGFSSKIELASRDPKNFRHARDKPDRIKPCPDRAGILADMVSWLREKKYVPIAARSAHRQLSGAVAPMLVEAASLSSRLAIRLEKESAGLFKDFPRNLVASPAQKENGAK